MSTKYRYCPNCSQPLEDNGECPGCTYGHKRQQQPKESQDRTCAWNDHGLPCHLIGHLSQTTLGSGPWYCRDHFAMLMGWPALRANVTDEAEESGANT